MKLEPLPNQQQTRDPPPQPISFKQRTFQPTPTPQPMLGSRDEKAFHANAVRNSISTAWWLLRMALDAWPMRLTT